MIRIFKRVPVCILALAPIVSIAQEQRIDSLRKEIEIRPGIAKYDPLIELVRAYASLDSVPKSLSWIHSARTIAFQHGDTIKIIQSSRMTGQLFNRLSMPKEAESVLVQVLPIAKRQADEDELMAIVNNLALAYGYQGRYDEALRMHFGNLERGRINGNKEAVATSLNNLGLIYYKLNDFARALNYYEQSVAIRKQIQEVYGMDLTLLNIAYCYVYLKEYGVAKKYTEEGLDVCKDNCSKRRRKEANLILGMIHLGLKDSSAAEHYLLQSLSLSKELSDSRYILDNINHLSRIYLARRQFEKAQILLKDGVHLAAQTLSATPEEVRLFKRVSELHYLTGDYQKASYFQNRSTALSDSIYDEELTINLMRVEADHLERENKARLAAQEEAMALNSKIIHNQKLTNIISIALAFVVIAFAMVLFRQYLRKNRDNTRLDQRVRERTHELEINREALLRALEERNLVLSQINAEVRDALSRFRGITSLSVAEIADPVARQYLDEVAKTAEDLSVNVGNYFSCQKTNSFV